MLKYLIIGNLGYVGSNLIRYLKKSNPELKLLGFDTGYFAHCLTGAHFIPEIDVENQIFGDVRDFDASINNYDLIFKDVEAVIYLAAISNDPMGNRFSCPTYEINCKSAINIAQIAKKNHVKNFVYASSCSMYGAGKDRPMVEDDEQNPLTAYAKSKVKAEQSLLAIADESMIVTSLRFCTACGMSPRLRLDLVLNDFVASALIEKKIKILSDGSPWRPLIHINDMARAIEWASKRALNNGGKFLSINIGRNDWNYQIKDLAYAVADIMPGVNIEINKDAQPDKRSYKVNFDLFKSLAPDYQPQYDLEKAVIDLRDGLKQMDFNQLNFRNSWYMRLKVLDEHLKAGIIDDNLRWKLS